MKGGKLLPINLNSQVYTGTTHPPWIQSVAPPAYLDAVGMTTDKSIRISLLNRHPTADARFHINLDGFNVDSVEIIEMYSDDLSAKASRHAW